MYNSVSTASPSMIVVPLETWKKKKRFLMHHENNTVKWEATDPTSVLQNIPVVINGVRRGDTEAVAGGLEAISQSIQDMTEALKLMHGKNKNKNKHSDSSAFKAITTLTDTFFVKHTSILKCSTASWESSCPGIKLLCFFFSFLPMTHQLFIQWMMTCNFVSVQRWKDNPCMPKGLVYEGVQVEPMEYSGGSAAQSSLLHCFDELLGVEHEAKSGKRGDFELLFSQQQRHTER